MRLCCPFLHVLLDKVKHFIPVRQKRGMARVDVQLVPVEPAQRSHHVLRNVRNRLVVAALDVRATAVEYLVFPCGRGAGGDEGGVGLCLQSPDGFVDERLFDAVVEDFFGLVDGYLASLCLFRVSRASRSLVSSHIRQECSRGQAYSPAAFLATSRLRQPQRHT